MRRKLPASLLLTALLLTSACGSGSDDDSSAKAKSTASSSVKVTGDVGTAPTVKFSAPLKVSKASTKVTTTGDGAKLLAGKTALVHLTLKNGATGKAIGSTYDDGAPTALVLDSTNLPAPLIKALVGKTVGSRVVVTSKAGDIYGASGNSSINLKAKDGVVIIFDIVAAQATNALSGPKGKATPLPAGAPKLVEKGNKISTLDFSKAAKKPTKLKVIPLVTGTGVKTKATSLITINYIGQVYGAKKSFNNTYTAGATATFPLGTNGLIKAWDQALIGLPIGSRVMLIAPPSVAYGAEGQPDGGIPKNATLVFVIDILGASK